MPLYHFMNFQAQSVKCSDQRLCHYIPGMSLVAQVSLFLGRMTSVVGINLLAHELMMSVFQTADYCLDKMYVN